ncbi:hypothetical protein PHYC_01182 [Phycisphaerales bacterium]|nr:hypothetical protein PHYC_01182 [Phycisphaerales bacterium]
MIRAATACVFLVLLMLSAGCTIAGRRSVSAENELLRRRIIELEKQAALLTGERDELSLKLTETLRAGDFPAKDALESLPVCARVEMDRYCGFDPADPKSPATGVVVGFRPLDGRSRFVQIAGRVRIEAMTLPPSINLDATGEPARVAVATLQPPTLREAYRDGFGGARYEVVLPLQTPIERGPGKTPTLVIRVELTDALTKSVHQAERVIRPGQ